MRSRSRSANGLHNTNLKAEIAAFVTSTEETNVTKEKTTKLTDRQLIIIQTIKTNPHIAIPEMSRKTGVTERTIKRDIAYLQSIGLLRRVGGRKEGHWVLD